MYGISKEIESKFSPYTSPSFGALKPALRRLEEANCLTSKKVMSDGGKLSVYYSLTKEGQKELKQLILEPLTENPVQFITNAKLKLSCAGVLDKEQHILDNEYTDKDFYQRILLDNSLVEYSNLITIIEGFEKDNERNS